MTEINPMISSFSLFRLFLSFYLTLFSGPLVFVTLKLMVGEVAKVKNLKQGNKEDEEIEGGAGG